MKDQALVGPSAFLGNLKNLRKAQGLSLRAAARLIGVSLSTLQRYESRQTSPSIEKVDQIARAFNVDISVLIKVPGRR
jgi:transcriptional regulator with XRE-family HTH domain